MKSYLHKLTPYLILFTYIIFCILLFSQKKSDPLLKSAHDAYSSQKWKSTATLLDLYLKDSTVYSDNYKMAIISNLMTNDSDGVEKAISIITKTGTTFDTVLNDVAREFIKLKMFDDYEIVIHKLMHTYPQHKQYFYTNLINYRILLHQPKHVLRVIDEASQRGIDPTLYQKIKAENYILLDSLDMAGDIYHNILVENNNDLDAILFFANLYFVKGKLGFEKVEKEYLTIENPSNLDYAERRNKIGMIYREYFVKGIEWMERAQDLKTNETIEKNLNFMYDIQRKYSIDDTKRNFRKK